jgi:predicted nucleic acid-binding protein
MTHHVKTGVVADTRIVSELIFRDPSRPPSPWLQTVVPYITGKSIYVSHITVAELLAAAKNASPVVGHVDAVRGQIALLQVQWPTMEIVEAYSDLKANLPKGHRLADKSAEADRWIAATALTLDLPVISNDNAYDEVAGLDFIYVPPISNNQAKKRAVVQAAGLPVRDVKA